MIEYGNDNQLVNEVLAHARMHDVQRHGYGEALDFQSHGSNIRRLCEALLFGMFDVLREQLWRALPAAVAVEMERQAQQMLASAETQVLERAFSIMGERLIAAELRDKNNGTEGT